jgi:hypothetical protein
MDLPTDLLPDIIKFLDFSEFFSVSLFLPKSCITHYMTKSKIILSSTQQIDKLLTILANIDTLAMTEIKKALNLEIIYTISYEDTQKIKQIEGKSIKIYCKDSGTLIDINDAIDNFEIREVHFSKFYINLPVVFNILVNNSYEFKDTTIFFHNCSRLYMDDMTFFDRKYSHNNYYYNYYNNDIYFRYLKESELKQYLQNHSFMHVLADNYEITENYIKVNAQLS